MNNEYSEFTSTRRENQLKTADNQWASMISISNVSMFTVHSSRPVFVGIWGSGGGLNEPRRVSDSLFMESASELSALLSLLLLSCIIITNAQQPWPLTSNDSSHWFRCQRFTRHLYQNSRSECSSCRGHFLKPKFSVNLTREHEQRLFLFTNHAFAWV